MTDILNMNGTVIYTSEKEKLRNAVIDAVADGANLGGANLGDEDLRGADLGDANLWGADLGGAKILPSQQDELLAALGVKVEA